MLSISFAELYDNFSSSRCPDSSIDYSLLILDFLGLSSYDGACVNFSALSILLTNVLLAYPTAEIHFSKGAGTEEYLVTFSISI